MSRSTGNGPQAPLPPMYQKLLARRRRDCIGLSEAKVSEILGEFRQGPAGNPHMQLQIFLARLIQNALDTTRPASLRRSHFQCLRWVLERIDDAVCEAADSAGLRQVTPTESDEDSAAGMEAAIAIPQRLGAEVAIDSAEVAVRNRKRRRDGSVPDRPSETNIRHPDRSTEMPGLATGTELSTALLEPSELHRNLQPGPTPGMSAFAAPTFRTQPTRDPTLGNMQTSDRSTGNHTQRQQQLRQELSIGENSLDREHSGVLRAQQRPLALQRNVLTHLREPVDQRARERFPSQGRVVTDAHSISSFNATGERIEGTRTFGSDRDVSSRDGAVNCSFAGAPVDSYALLERPLPNQNHSPQTHCQQIQKHRQMDRAHPQSVEPGIIEMAMCADDEMKGKNVVYSRATTTRLGVTLSFSQENVPPSVIQQVFHRLNRWDPFWRMESVAQVGCTVTGVKRKLTTDDGTVKYRVCPLKTAMRLHTRPRRDLRQENQRCKEPAWGTSVDLPPEAGTTVMLLRMLPVDFKDKNRADCHCWPEGTFLQINGRPVSLEQRLKRSDSRENKWSGNCRSLNVTKFAASATELVRFEMCCYDKEPYFFCLAICTYRSPAQLASTLLDSSHSCGLERLGRVDGIEQAKKALNAYNEGEVVHVDAKFKLSVFCPISKSVIKDPVRGKQCKHYQCFDLTAFLESNATEGSLQRWRCAVCADFIAVEDLLVCEFTSDLLKEFPEATEQDLVEFLPDGTYKLVREQPEEVVDLT